MVADYYASSTPSLVLSWILCVPLLIGFIRIVFFAFQKHEEIPWLYSAWLGLCFLVLSPVRYEALLLTLAVSYPVQSITAFLSILTFWLWLPAAIAFALLNLIGVLGPLFLLVWIVGKKQKPSWPRFLVSALLAPIVTFAGSLLFSLVLPFAGITAHLLDTDSIIRATNGPAQVVFLSEGSAMIALPPYFNKTPQTYKDMLRCHVALMYLSRSDDDYFLKMAYPELYDEFHDAVMNPAM